MRITGFQRYDPVFTSPKWRGEWETVDLSPYAGQTILIGRINYLPQSVLQPGVNTVPVDASKCASRTYFLKIQMTDNSVMQKFNKE